MTITIICSGVFVSTLSFAYEKNSIPFIIFVSKDAKKKLKTVQTIAIFLNGNDSLLTRIVEDTIGIYLSNSGFMVVSREILEKAIVEKMAEKKRERKEGVINALEIGKAVNADSILIGTVIVKSTKQTLLIKVASFQLVDVINGNNLLSIVFEPKEDKSFSEIVQRFIEILKQSMD